MNVPGTNPLNQEWAGRPRSSEYGQAFRRNLAGRLIADPPPLVARSVREGARGMRDQFGVMLNTTSYPPPLLALSYYRRYDGQLPLQQFSKVINKPQPWER